MRSYLIIPMALVALGIAGASPSVAQTAHRQRTQQLYDYAPGYGNGAGYNSGPSAPAPQYVPGYGNIGAGAGPSNHD
jgi:hypothetical protein